MPVLVFILHSSTKILVVTYLRFGKKKVGGGGVKLSEAKVEGRIEEGRGSISVHIWE